MLLSTGCASGRTHGSTPDGAASAGLAEAHEVAASLPPVVAALGAEGFWFGMCSVSPLGAVPYPLTTSWDGPRLVVSVSMRAGLGGFPNPYQRFTFAPDAAHGSVVAFESGLPGEAARAELVERARDATTTRYCASEAEGGCAAVALTISGGAQAIDLATEVRGVLHHKVRLSTAVP